MAMFEQSGEGIDNAIARGGGGGGGGGGGSSSSSRGQYDRDSAPAAAAGITATDDPNADACARCGTAVVIPPKKHHISVSRSSATTSLSPAESRTNFNDLFKNTAAAAAAAAAAAPSNAASRSASSRNPGTSMATTASPRPIRSESPMVGMRGAEGGGAPGAGRAAEPVRGLKAFGSQGDLSSMAAEALAMTNQLERTTARHHNGPSPPPRLPQPAEIVHAPPKRSSCKCGHDGQQQEGARSRAGGGGAGTPTGSEASGAGRPASRGSSPVTRTASGGVMGGVGKGSAATGPSAGAHSSTGDAVPARDPGYRVLKWSDLTHLTYMTAGAMCEIYSAELDGVKVAVKVPRKDCEEPAVAEHDLEVELDVLKRVNHKHIIALVGAGMRDEKPHRFLALEFLELGTLADKLDAGSKPDGTTESTFLRRQKRTKKYQDFYMVTMLERSLELAMALEHLHHHMPETFVVHRDLKPDNVGFKADGTLKLFDFGLARVVKRRNRVNARYEMTGETGSMRYMAPEVVESLPYNEKVDVYAFGLLLWEMLEDRRVFDGMGVSDFYERVVNAGARPNLDPAWPQDLRKLISQCWHADVDRRPNFRAIAERLRDLYTSEKQSSKLCMSALNLNEDEHPKLRGGSSVNVVPRSATTTNIVSPHRGGGPSSQTEIGKKGGMLRRSFSKIGRILKPNKGGAKATLVHTAPEAYSRPMVKGRPAPLVEERGSSAAGHTNGGAAGGELSEEVIYGEGGKKEGSSQIMPRRAFSDGMIVNNPTDKRT